MHSMPASPPVNVRFWWRYGGIYSALKAARSRSFCISTHLRMLLCCPLACNAGRQQQNTNSKAWRLTGTLGVVAGCALVLLYCNN